MTYASIILPYKLKKNKVNADPKKKQSLMGKLKSAAHSGKNFIENSGAVFSVLGEYMQETEPIVSKFSGIAVAQMLSDGKVTNQEALDYLFLGFAPALDQQALAMGYSGVTQMKDAIANGKINVGSFVSGFSKTLKSATDYSNGIKNKMEQAKNNVIEIDITLNHNEQYQSESPDRRVENGISYQEVLHNMPETFSLECGFSELKHKKDGITASSFKEYLTQLRESKQVFSMEIGEKMYENLTLQNFSPSVTGARSGLDYTLELKKVYVGSVESVPITMQPPPKEQTESAGKGISKDTNKNVSIPNIINNPLSPTSGTIPNKRMSLLYENDLYFKRGY